MKRLIFILLIGLLVVGCSKEDSLNSADRNIVADDGSNPFEELLILISLKTSDSTYLVVKSIDSVHVYINNYSWATINSEVLDTAKFDKSLVGNTYQTETKINYLVMAKQDIVQPVLTTAGEFSRYMNGAFELKPGEYACLIESFQVRFNDNSTKKYYPYTYSSFKVEQNSRSAFVGEIEIKLAK